MSIKTHVEAIRTLADSIANEFVDFSEVVYIGPGLEFSATWNGGQATPRYVLDVDYDVCRLAVVVALTVWPHSGIEGHYIKDQFGLLDSQEDFAARWRGRLEKAKQEGVF